MGRLRTGFTEITSSVDAVLMMAGMKIVITGGIASGKSTVAKYLSKVTSSSVFDADVICFELLAKNRPGWLGVQQKWGELFFDNNGDIDRKLLRQAVFSENNIRYELEGILHPLARKEMQDIASRNSDSPFLLFEVPLLFEVGWQGDFDWVVSVYSEKQQQIERVCKRDKVSEQEAEKIISAQMDSKEKAILSDSVIDNSGSWSDTCLQIFHMKNLLMGAWQKPKKGAVLP